MREQVLSAYYTLERCCCSRSGTIFFSGRTALVILLHESGTITYIFFTVIFLLCGNRFIKAKVLEASAVSWIVARSRRA